jgi:hypothetical protein
MYTTLDIMIVCVLGGCALALYVACALHYREVLSVRDSARKICRAYDSLRGRHDEASDLLIRAKELFKAQQVAEQEEEYNGWINRETWAFVLWQSGEAHMYDLMREMSAQIAVDEGMFTQPFDPESHLFNMGLTQVEKRNLGARYVKEWTEYAKEVSSDYGTSNHSYSMALEEIGSMWRVDPESVGDYLEENVRDVLFKGEDHAIVDKEEFCDLLGG